MPSISTIAISAAALLTMVQYCPATFLAAIPAAVSAGIGAAGAVVGAAGAVTGGVSTALHNSKRDEFHSRIKRQNYGTGTA